MPESLVDSLLERVRRRDAEIDRLRRLLRGAAIERHDCLSQIAREFGDSAQIAEEFGVPSG